MEGVEEQQNDAEGDDATKDDGVATFPDVDTLDKAVDKRILIWKLGQGHK